MKHALTIFLAVAASLAAVYLWGPQSTSNAPVTKETAYERVMRTGTLRCGYGYWDPLYYVDSKTAERKGIMFEATEAMAKILGLKVEWTEEVPWNGMILGLNNGRYDAICSGKWVYGPEGKEASYTLPVMYNIVHVYARKDDNRFENTSKLNNENIVFAVQDGDNSTDLANEYFPKAKQLAIAAGSDPTLQVMNVITKKADVTILDAATAQGFVRNNPDQVKLLTKYGPLRAYEVTYMFGMGDSKMESLLNSGIRQLHTQGIMERIIKKYVDNPETIYTVSQPYQSYSQ